MCSPSCGARCGIRTGSSSIVTARAATTQNVALTYDEASNVTSIADAVAGETVTYGYDDHDRLISASGFTGGLTASYTYNQAGNLLTKVEGASSYRLCYPNPTGSRPHAVLTVIAGASNPCSAFPWRYLGYDANGNMTYALGFYTYDYENRLVSRPLSTAGEREEFTYDAGGTMVKSRNSVTNAYTVYVGGLYEKKSNGDVTKYYGALGRTIAIRTVPNGSGTLETGAQCQDAADSDFDARQASPASTAMQACRAPLWSPIATTDGNGGSSGSPLLLAKPLLACAM